MTRGPVSLRSPLWLVLACSLWMAVPGNWVLWRRLGQLGLLQGAAGAGLAVALAVMLTAALTALLALLAWRLTLKPAATLLLVAAATGSHFMGSYGLVIDPGMMQNVLQTDLHEARALVDGRLLLALAVLAGLPAWWLWRQPTAPRTVGGALWQNLAAAAAALLVLAAAVLAGFQPLASAMRNHKELRYLLNPVNSLYAVARNAGVPRSHGVTAPARVGEDAQAAQVALPGRPPLLVLVLGETGRSGNFGLNGYARDTTPELAREAVVSFRNAWSCGTSTAVSVPCMFSGLGQAHFTPDAARGAEGLMDVLHHAGLAVLWLDNQSGCKGTCDRVPHIATCPQGDCLDDVMLDGLDERLAALEPARRARGTVVVMHQIGSHGPAYHLRSAPAHKRFVPECTEASLQACSRAAIVNAYDNSIAATDHMLALTIGWLKARGDVPTAMLYVADHGESLGENNLYLHGMPDAIAPELQKRVPWVTWMSAAWQRATGIDPACLAGRRDDRISHDHYFHSVLGLMDVQTRVYRRALDAYAPCRADAVTSARAAG
jgi:lipid A ethanolaminephosphotransferase